MNTNKNQKVFFELVKAGLWGKEVRLSQYGEIDFNEIYRLAQEQSVVGLVASGLEKVTDLKVPQTMALTIAGRSASVGAAEQGDEPICGSPCGGYA